ncbi:hypothetical protein [Paraburkholderia xenovorans]|uniref:hypothetical protein n=1 Tax=Paraburkholderia xenovorans TaxID=36873 RepID=UPI0038B9FFAF
MRQTVLGVFEKFADARSAQRTLGEAGVAQADIAIYSMSNDTPVEKGPRVYAPGSGDVRHHNPVFDQLEKLFARLFKSGQYPAETEDYREVIRRGGAIVSADVSEMQVDLARDLMRRAGAADIEERAKVWRNDSGLSEQAPRRDSSTTRDHSRPYEPSSAQQGDTIAHGGHVAEMAPSSTTEYLANPCDASPLQVASRSPISKEPAADGTVIQGTATPSVGAKTVVGGMQQVATRTEGPGSTSSVENRQELPGEPRVGHTRTPEGARGSVRSTAAAYSSDDSTGTTTARKSGTGLMGEPDTATPVDDTPYDAEFRADYDAHYANTGASYDEYQRAYSHGATLGNDERYRGHDWQRVETNARENWQSRYPESGWERFKAAVRHGWDRVTGG